MITCGFLNKEISVKNKIWIIQSYPPPIHTVCVDKIWLVYALWNDFSINPRSLLLLLLLYYILFIYKYICKTKLQWYVDKFIHKEIIKMKLVCSKPQLVDIINTVQRAIYLYLNVLRLMLTVTVMLCLQVTILIYV